MDDVTAIRNILTAWADNTQQGHKDKILANHALDVLIYDVLPPMKYQSAAEYRASWDEWQPVTVGENTFSLQDLVVTAGNDVAFAHAFILCGGTSANGKSFQDLVRATFCLKKIAGEWKIVHQHISKPLSRA